MACEMEITLPKYKGFLSYSTSYFFLFIQVVILLQAIQF